LIANCSTLFYIENEKKHAHQRHHASQHAEHFAHRAQAQPRTATHQFLEFVDSDKPLL